MIVKLIVHVPTRSAVAATLGDPLGGIGVRPVAIIAAFLSLGAPQPASWPDGPALASSINVSIHSCSREIPPPPFCSKPWSV